MVQQHQRDDLGSSQEQQQPQHGDEGGEGVEVQVTNLNDITLIADEDDDEDLLHEDRESDEFNFAAAVELRKNLSETFERAHNQAAAASASGAAGTGEGVPSRPVGRRGSVLAKIAELERIRNGGGESSGGGVVVTASSATTAMRPVSSGMRLPVAPTSKVHASAGGGQLTRSTSDGGSLLSVFLRIRPPPEGGGELALANTIDILGVDDGNGGESSKAVAVRT